jgi:GTP-binding protein Era
MEHRAGFVNIIGKPNAGKSTLMNALIGEKLSIITSKAQTTRHRIIGLVNHDDYQLVLSDTPGILNPKYELQRSMMKLIYAALGDADLLIFLVDATDETLPEDISIFEKVKQSSAPLLVVINKSDLVDPVKLTEVKTIWDKIFPDTTQFCVSALKKINTDDLLLAIIDRMPYHPPYYPKDEISDRNMRFFAAEIIREKILLNYKQEIPYATQIEIESYQETPAIVKISATIYIERDSQKGIIIGDKGSSIKKTGTEARLDIEQFIGQRVFLDLHVKVRKNWRSNPTDLKRFGYES